MKRITTDENERMKRMWDESLMIDEKARSQFRSLMPVIVSLLLEQHLQVHRSMAAQVSQPRCKTNKATRGRDK